MTDREKLIELLVKSTQKCDSTDCNRCKYWNTNDCGAARMADIVISDGWIRPPVSVGQTVWFVRNGKIIETEVEKIVLKSKGLYLKLGCNAMYETSCNSIGKTVFLTREEAEKALAERGVIYEQCPKEEA